MDKRNVVKAGRFGTFSIDSSFVREHPDVVLELIRNVLVVRCEAFFNPPVLRYSGYSWGFTPVEEGEGPRDYPIDFTYYRQYGLETPEVLSFGAPGRTGMRNVVELPA